MWIGGIYMIDENAIYELPTSRKDQPETIETLQRCRIRVTSIGKKSQAFFYMLVPLDSNYREKGFYAEYFEYLIRHGYARKVSND